MKEKSKKNGVPRLGLCCLFLREPIKFRTTTATSLLKISKKERLLKVSALCLQNAESLLAALKALRRLGIGAFRINSQFFPVYTHPGAGYTLDELPQRSQILALLSESKRFRDENDIRLSFHPDQFVALSSPHTDVVRNSVNEIEYQALLAELVGAELINIHLGGAYGNKTEALGRFAKSFRMLSRRARERLGIENDDVSYTPLDVLRACELTGAPFVYDIHHHRCLPDALSEEEATEHCVAIWKELGREPWLHISSPKDGWKSRNPKAHADYINPSDFPECWRGIRATVDVEAKAKESAVGRLLRFLNSSFPK